MSVWAMLVEIKCPRGGVGLLSPPQRKENACMDELACLGYVSGKKASMWTSWPTWVAVEARTTFG